MRFCLKVIICIYLQMPNQRTVEISCELFQGYQIQIDLDYVNNNDEIVQAIVCELQFFLKECNLNNLM